MPGTSGGSRRRSFCQSSFCQACSKPGRARNVAHLNRPGQNLAEKCRAERLPLQTLRSGCSSALGLARPFISRRSAQTIFLPIIFLPGLLQARAFTERRSPQSAGPELGRKMPGRKIAPANFTLGMQFSPGARTPIHLPAVRADDFSANHLFARPAQAGAFTERRSPQSAGPELGRKMPGRKIAPANFTLGMQFSPGARTPIHLPAVRADDFSANHLFARPAPSQGVHGTSLTSIGRARTWQKNAGQKDCPCKLYAPDAVQTSGSHVHSSPGGSRRRFFCQSSFCQACSKPGRSRNVADLNRPGQNLAEKCRVERLPLQTLRSGCSSDLGLARPFISRWFAQTIFLPIIFLPGLLQAGAFTERRSPDVERAKPLAERSRKPMRILIHLGQNRQRRIGRAASVAGRARIRPAVSGCPRRFQELRFQRRA